MADRTEAMFQRMLLACGGDLHETLKGFGPWLLNENDGDQVETESKIGELVARLAAAQEPEEGVILEDEPDETPAAREDKGDTSEILITCAGQLGAALSSPAECARISREAAQRRRVVGWVVANFDQVGGSPLEWHEQVAAFMDTDPACALQLLAVVRKRYPEDPKLRADELACAQSLMGSHGH